MIPLLEVGLRSIPTGNQYQDLLDLLQWFGQLFSSLFTINLPWFNFRFGEFLIAPVFIGILYGVFKLIFSSVGSAGRSDHND